MRPMTQYQRFSDEALARHRAAIEFEQLVRSRITSAVSGPPCMTFRNGAKGGFEWCTLRGEHDECVFEEEQDHGFRLFADRMRRADVEAETRIEEGWV